MSNKDNVVEFSHPSIVSEAAPSVHNIPFVQVSRELIQKSKLPIDARMLLIYLISFPKFIQNADGSTREWVFHDSVIREDLGIGFSKLKLLFKELRDAGYVKTVPIIGDKGRMVGSKRLFSSVPEFSKKPPDAASSTESMETRQSAEPTVRKSEAKYINNKYINNINKKINKKDFDLEFDEFWTQYPKKVDKHKAKETYNKILGMDYGLHAVILFALCAQNEERAIKAELGIWQADPKGPDAWLKAKRWDDQDIKTREQLENECGKNRHGQRGQNGYGQYVGRQPSKLESRNNLIRNETEQAIEEARRIFSEREDGDSEC